MADRTQDSVALWTLLVPVLALGLIALKFADLVSTSAPAILGLAVVLLGASVFAAVHHAEVLALKLGEPFGSILLAVAVTVIEVALIVTILLSEAPGSQAVARDTVYSAVMIVLNGVIGLCLVMGGRRHYQQTFQVDGASATLAVLGTLAVFALIMPNFTDSTRTPDYAPVQLVVVGAVSLALYVVFVFVQAVRHRDYFVDATTAKTGHAAPSSAVSAASAVLLLAALAAVVVLAKLLSEPLSLGVIKAGLPVSFVGVVIAMVVLLPEGIAAVKAALSNRLQGSINLALGSAVASIGLTIPTVALVSLIFDMPLILGLSDEDMVLLMLTLFAATLTLGTGRTTVLQGAVHLVIFSVFLLLSVIP
jgi:Ca2+:H+ antiporter